MLFKRPPPLKQPTVGKLIRELRLAMGLTQEQFAIELGVTCSSVNRWENRRSQPLPLAMQKIAEMLKQMSDSSDATLRDRAADLLKRYLAK